MTDWATWTIAICTASGMASGVTVMLLKGIFVTRKEINQARARESQVDRERHSENVRRLEGQDKVLVEIQKSVARIEGQISGRYPRIDR
jgi:hypothetical protein